MKLNDFKTLYHGRKLLDDDGHVVGRISISRGLGYYDTSRWYCFVCTNLIQLDGCVAENKLGYDYSFETYSAPNMTKGQFARVLGNCELHLSEEPVTLYDLI